MALFDFLKTNIIKDIGDILDENITTKEEKMTKINEVADKMMEILNGQKDIILAEAAGSKLQRNWRPILALSFGFIVVSTYFIFPFMNIFIKNQEITSFILDLKSNNNFWTLLTVMIGGYTISRGLEKITDIYTTNKIEIEKAKQ